MKRKESIIRYIAHVTRANRHQIAEAINATPQIVTARLTELRHSGIVRRVEWSDGSMVWTLTQPGAERFDYYQKRDSQQEQESQGG